jgi:1-acyl-sn-glycerol-3-phosphate acyltransferase
MIRNFLFLTSFYSGIILISLLFLPSLLLPKKFVLFGGRVMGIWTIFCLKKILSVKIIIKGKENIIYKEKFFIASSHQSIFETFFLQTIFNSPIFILKKELLKIPIFGWYLSKIGSISIDRNKTTKRNVGFFDLIKKSVNSSNRPLIIFPQGTRLLPTDRSPFKKGVSRIYDELQIACQPVAINSGNVWPKNNNLKSNLTITISILSPINSGMGKEIFLKDLQSCIYKELDNLD